MRGWKTEQMVFLDKSAACKRTRDRKYGWFPRGQKATVQSLFKRSKRWSILPACTVNGYITFIVHYGLSTTQILNQSIAEQVLPQCTPYAER